jgi:uncharacterized protein YndB with AHSA1/START domain
MEPDVAAAIAIGGAVGFTAGSSCAHPRPTSTLVAMPDILQDFPIRVAPEAVFAAISTARGLDAWWSKAAVGTPRVGASYELGFGDGYDWRASVTECTAPTRFELTMTDADTDWQGTRVGFELRGMASGTQVSFYHVGWPAANEHFRVSCHCWALYLRLLRRYLETGEVVPYERRLEA